MNDGKKSKTLIHPFLINEIRLPEVIDGMATLQVDSSIDEFDSNISKAKTSFANGSLVEEASNIISQPVGKRVLRKRTVNKNLLEDTKQTLNRRVSLRPRKRTYSEIRNDDDIKDYYLDKRIKKMPSTLETIFEEDETNDVSVHIGRKKKRLIQFSGKASAAKIKKRRAKIKLLGKTLFKGKVKISQKTDE